MTRSRDWRRECNAPDSRLAALLDGELPFAEQQQLEEHLRFCARCVADLAQQRAAQAALRRTAAILIPSPALRTRVQQRLPDAEPRRSTRRWLVLFGGMAAVIALVASVSLLLWAQRAPSETVLKRAVAVHKQETLGATPVSFASSDAEAVSAWARAQTGVSLEVPVLDSAGYTLLGARLDGGVDAKAIALVYQGADGRMTCTILPALSPAWARLPELAPPIHVQEIGDIGVASWEEGDATYIMAAHLHPPLLLQLARLVLRTAF